MQTLSALTALNVRSAPVRRRAFLIDSVGAGHPGEEDIGGMVLVCPIYLFIIEFTHASISWPGLLRSWKCRILHLVGLRMDVVWLQLLLLVLRYVISYHYLSRLDLICCAGYQYGFVVCLGSIPVKLMGHIARHTLYGHR